MMAVNIANGLAEIDIESHICTTRLEGDLKSKLLPTVDYLFLEKKTTLDIRAFKKLNNYIKYHKIQIIHAHSSSYFIAFLIKISNPVIKIVWHDHYGGSENLESRNTFLLRVLSKSFESVISVNRLLHGWTQKYLKAKSQHFLPNFASFNLEMKQTTFLKGTDKKRIVCLANLRPQKDHINLLKAFKLIHKDYQDWTLHLVGMDFKNLYSDEVKSYIKTYNLKNHVFLYGSCADTEHILKQATIGVLASKSEGLPVALLEYGLAKLPVVVTNVGDCGNVVSDEINGIVTTPENDTALAEGIHSLITDEEKQIIFGEEFYKVINRNYSSENYIKQLIIIYQF